jgi:hypothetical protein
MRMQYYLAMVLLSCMCVGTLFAQDMIVKPRLTRVAAHDADGKLYAESTVGNLIVDGVGDMRRKIQSYKSPEVVKILTEHFYCNSTGTSEVIKISVANRLKKKTKDEELLLRAGDTAAIHLLALETIGYLDNINPQAIADDEAIGPGVYHDAIAGMEQALQVCNFYGHLR